MQTDSCGLPAMQPLPERSGDGAFGMARRVYFIRPHALEKRCRASLCHRTLERGRQNKGARP